MQITQKDTINSAELYGETKSGDITYGWYKVNLKSLIDNKNYACYAAGYWVVTEKDECRSSYPTTTVNIMP